ncbi:MAG TPA: PfkB family carbohydrate kinase [Terriglobales bacterium]|nr:PfkB family carbohydrate kinase [Terriglobales bacterium]
MRFLRIDEDSSYQLLVGVGGLGTGMFFQLEGDHSLGRNESRLGRLLDVKDYCKLHIVSHYVAKLLGARPVGRPFHVVPVGHVGDDPAGRHVVQQMTEVGMDTSFVRLIPAAPTLFSVCFQYPDGTGGNITTSNSAAGTLSRSDIDAMADLLSATQGRFIALAVPEVPLEVRQHFLELASPPGAFRAASFVAAEVQPARAAGMFDLLDLVALNESEAEELVGHRLEPESPEPFLRHCQRLLHSFYPHLQLVVSAGKAGAYGLTAKTQNFCPAPRVKVASTAGAGDALLGGILAAIAAGLPFLRTDGNSRDDRSIETALEFGVLLASYKCLSPHTINPSASIDALMEFAGDIGRSFSPDFGRLFVGTAPAHPTE